MRFIKNSLLFFFVPLTIIGQAFKLPPEYLFFAASLGIIPLAAYLGEATEALESFMGPRMGGLLNATMGNAAELIITTAAIAKSVTHPALKKGLMELVKASITGSILGNLLLILGFSLLLGGIKYKRQFFDKTYTNMNTSMLILSVIALAVPSFFNTFHGAQHVRNVQYLSYCVAIIMILLYFSGIFFSFQLKKKTRLLVNKAKWGKKKSITILIISTSFIAYMSEIVVGTVDGTVRALGISEFFIGIILIPIIGNISEHVVAVQMALKDKMELAVSISLGSSLQIALFVAPILVFISVLFGNPLTLVFNPFEVVALMCAVIIASFIAYDGESNWIEGAQLLGVYLILSIGFYFM